MRTNVLILFTILAASSVLFAFQDNSLEQSIKRGEEVYTANCVTCHMQKGEGLEGSFPPLAKADFLAKDKTGKKAIGAVLNGLTDEITVNGKKYNVPMPAQNYLTDQQIADVLNFVRNSWGNKAKAITEEMVKAGRNKRSPSKEASSCFNLTNSETILFSKRVVVCNRLCRSDE